MSPALGLGAPAAGCGPVPSRYAPCTPAKGFTTIELMVVVAILAILASLAAPSFMPLIERWRVRQTVEGLQSTLYYARSEAIRRGGEVVVKKLPNGTNGCTLAAELADWGCGWMVVAGGKEIRQMEVAANITVTSTKSNDKILLDRWGGMNGLTAEGFTIAPYPKGISSPATKGLCVSAGGRIKVIDRELVPCTP